MKLTEQDIDLIDAYLAGELSGEDLLAFELRMAGDVEFADEVGMMEALRVGVKRSVLEDKMRLLKQVDSRQSIVDGGIDVDKTSMDHGLSTMDSESKDSVDHGPSTMDSKGKVPGLWKVLAVAASIGVIGFVGSWWMGEMEEKSQYLALEEDIFAYPDLITERSTGEGGNPEAMQFYSLGDYGEALKYFNQAEELDGPTSFYKAISLLKSGEIEDAYLILKVLNLDGFPSDFYKGIIELNSNIDVQNMSQFCKCDLCTEEMLAISKKYCSD